jgi:hypothetical protein
MAAEMTPKAILKGLNKLFKKKGYTMEVVEHRFDDSAKHAQAYVYHLKQDELEVGVVSIGHIGHTEIADVSYPVIHVRDIDVKESERGKGIAQAILLYGLCDEIDRHPEIEYSFLEDDTPFAQDDARNLYYKFGYRFKEGDLQEKVMYIEEFKSQHMPALFHKLESTFMKDMPNRNNSKGNSRRTRSKSRVRSKSRSKRT